MNSDYLLSKIDVKPITGPWWTLTQFQKGFKSANKYYVEVIDRNGKKPTKWMFKIEEVSLGQRGMPGLRRGCNATYCGWVGKRTFYAG